MSSSPLVDYNNSCNSSSIVISHHHHHGGSDSERAPTTTPSALLVQQTTIDDAHKLLLLDNNNLLPNNHNNNNNIDDKSISNGACRGPSSNSSTSGYDDSSDGEDNHLINHTHLHHHQHDAFIINKQQPSSAIMVETTATATEATAIDRDNNDISSINLARDMHLVDERMRGLCERDPHHQQRNHHQMQLKAASLAHANNSRQQLNNNKQNYNSNYLTAPYNTTNNDSQVADDSDLDLHHLHHHYQQQQQQRYYHHHRRDGNNTLLLLDSAGSSSSSFMQVRPLGLATLPIDDFDLIEESLQCRYSNGEKQLRIKMCAVYRLIEIFGWSMGIYNHVTAKVEGDHEHLLIHPFGLHYNEITASSMLKIDLAGNIVDNGSTNFELNRPGYLVHSAIHMARPDIGAVIHLHYPPVAAASAFKFGLLPICQEQALLGEVRYLDYSGILTDEDEREAVAAGLGRSCKVMILRNHGLIVCGATIEEAFYLLSNLMKACETQARLCALNGMDSIIFMSPDAAQQAYDTVQNSRYSVKVQKSDKRHAQVIGHINMFELDFEAQMRALDHAGHRTGYQYKRPLLRKLKSNKSS